MDEPQIQMHRDAEAIDKLTKPPVEVKVGIYEVDPDGSDELKRIGESVGYLHRLTWLELNHIRAANATVYKFSIANGATKEEAKEAVTAVIPRMTVYFALKSDLKAPSTRFFQSQEALLAFPYEQEIWDIYATYLKEFSLSAVEWGNLLRATNCGISSDLPSSSKGRESLDTNSPS